MRGNFFIQRDPDTELDIETFDETLQIVRQPYFDRVWSHYRDEFQQKIFALKEELFNCWFELLLPGQPAQIAVEEVKDRLNRQPERLLLFRVKSFLGYYTGVDLSGMEQFELKEERAVEELERKEGKSYLFDDAIANLAIEKERDRPLIVETYGETKQMLEQVLFGPDINTNQSALRELADKFNLLVHVFPANCLIDAPTMPRTMPSRIHYIANNDSILPIAAQYFESQGYDWAKYPIKETPETDYLLIIEPLRIGAELYAISTTWKPWLMEFRPHTRLIVAAYARSQHPNCLKLFGFLPVGFARLVRKTLHPRFH